MFYLLLGLLDGEQWLLWPLFAFYGVFLAATEGAEKALVADLAPRPLLGTAYGWFNLTTGLMLLPASFVFGWLWQNVGPCSRSAFRPPARWLAVLLLKFWVADEASRFAKPSM